MSAGAIRDIPTWARFAGVGLIGLAVQLATLHVLHDRLHLPPLVAVVLAVEAAILHNFVWHVRWTWRERVPGSSVRMLAARLASFHAASGGLALAGNLVLTGAFGALGVHVVPANAVAVACLAALNFVLADRVVFRRTRAHPPFQHGATRLGAVLVPMALLGSAPPEAIAGQPRPETLAAWERYVLRVEARRGREARDGTPLRAMARSSSSGHARLMARLSHGEIVASDADGDAADLAGGTIAHWRGYVLLRSVTLDEVLDAAALRGRAAEHRQQDVLEARVLSREGNAYRLFLKLQWTAIVSATYNTEHHVTYERSEAGRGASRSVSTRIAELTDVGTPGERERPPDQDRGYLWRLNAYWRYDVVPGGVLVELESLTLGRSVPWGLRAIARPIIARLARESTIRTLESFRARWPDARRPATTP